MLSATQIVTTEEAKQGFYPTPPELAKQLLEGLDFSKIKSVLEPSAGSGNLIDAVAEKLYLANGYTRYAEYRTNVDAIEIDPALQALLTYSWGGQYVDKLREESSQIKEKWDNEERCYIPLSEADSLRKNELESERNKRSCVTFHLIHDDFLTYGGRTKYDLIVMNPPFADGDAHLLKALAVMQPYGGEIRCILNAETIRNPYTNRRKVLIDQLGKYGATVTFTENAFVDAERPTDVEVALISVSLPSPTVNSRIWDDMEKANPIQESEVEECTGIAPGTEVEAALRQYQMELDGGLTLIREYKALQPYIRPYVKKPEGRWYGDDSMLTLSVGKGNDNLEKRYVRYVRRKYWHNLLHKDEITGQMTSSLQEKYRDMVEELENYDFSEFNIRKLLTEMNAEMCQGVEDTIMALFQRMTGEHSYYPEFSKNIHLYNGWKTNQAHKIGQKVILPCNGVFSSCSWDRDSMSEYTMNSTISDIEKVLDYLAGDRHGCAWNTARHLQIAAQTSQSKDIPCKYFSVTFYKKGTMHIKFYDNAQPLLERFNIFASQKKGWLPPTYGRAHYADMSDEEKAVVDSFHGNGNAGSGEKVYSEIMADKGYYLTSPAESSSALLPGC